jgi:hypothetical protein
MYRLKQKGLAAILAVVLLGIPITPAVAAGPLLLAPFILGRHVLDAVVTLATLPYLANSAAVYGSPSASYPPAPSYYVPQNYYGRAPRYYPAPQIYYAPRLSYTRLAPRYASPYAYHGPRRYSGAYGGQVFYRSPAMAYRHR